MFYHDLRLPKKLSASKLRELALYGLRVKAANHCNELKHRRENPFPREVAEILTRRWVKETYGSDE